MIKDRNVWVFIEQDEGHIHEVSLELLSKAQELAQILGSQVWAVLCGTRSRSYRMWLSSMGQISCLRLTILSWSCTAPCRMRA